jgi:hypothetical protein
MPVKVSSRAKWIIGQEAQGVAERYNLSIDVETLPPSGPPLPHPPATWGYERRAEFCAQACRQRRFRRPLRCRLQNWREDYPGRLVSQSKPTRSQIISDNLSGGRDEDLVFDVAASEGRRRSAGWINRARSMRVTLITLLSNGRHVTAAQLAERVLPFNNHARRKIAAPICSLLQSHV